jgi:hypothetical protein
MDFHASGKKENASRGGRFVLLNDKCLPLSLAI